MGKKVTNSEIRRVINKTLMYLVGMDGGYARVGASIRTCTPMFPCLCPCAYVSVSMRAYGYIRTTTTQQHKYSGYFNICSFSQKKYVVSEWNLTSRNCCEKQILDSLFSSAFDILARFLCFADCVFEKTAFSCPIPYSVDKPCGQVRKTIDISSANPNGLILGVAKNKLSSFSVLSPLLDKVRLVWIVLANHRDSALTFMPFIDNNTARRFERCKKPSDLSTTNFKIFRHLCICNASISNSTSTFIMFTQHKLIIAEISDYIAEKIPFQLVHEFTEGIILLIVIDYNVTSIRHTNPAYLKYFGLRGHCNKVAVIRELKERGFACLGKNTPCLCVTNAEHILYYISRNVIHTTAGIIHFYGNKETITIPRTSFIKMFLNGADYNIVSPFLGIYYDVFLCQINLLRDKNKTLTPSAAWHKGFYILFGLRLQNMSKTSHHSRLVTMQKYNEFPKHARNVNSVLTLREQQNLRKIAAKENTIINNSLYFRTLKEYTKWNICQWNIIGDFYCLPP